MAISRRGRAVGMILFLGLVFVAAPLRAEVDFQALREWGLETASAIDASLKKGNGSNLYAEVASLTGEQSGGYNGYAYVWPVATQFRVLNSLTQLDPTNYTSVLRSFSDEVHARYWSTGYRSGAGGGDRFYDDNAHLVVSLTEAYRLTNDLVYLDRARRAFGFVLRGEDTVAGGGIYFKENDFSSKDAISTLQGARGAAMLYRATGFQRYLDDATRLLTWAEGSIQHSSGLFSQRWDIAANQRDGVELVNSAGIAISANLELYDATGTASYLDEARRIGKRSLSRYFDGATGRINDEGYWAFELVDGLVNLYLHDGNEMWLEKANGALTWLHENKRDPLGHYDLFWGRGGTQVGTLSTWELNNQAAVARAYLYTALAVPEPASGLLLALGVAALGGRRGYRSRNCRGGNAG